MNEREFIVQLQDRAAEQKRVMQSMPFPYFYLLVVEWLGNHPWKILIPLALFLSLLFRLVFGPSYSDSILLLFRKL